MCTFVGGSEQLPLGKPSANKSTARSDAVPPVVANELSLRQISPEAVTYEMVSDPQNIVPAYLSLVSSDPLTVPVARWPSILNSPDNGGELGSFLRLALTGSTPQLDSNVPLHSPVTAGCTGPGEVGRHAERHVRTPATSTDRCMSSPLLKQGRYRDRSADSLWRVRHSGDAADVMERRPTKLCLGARGSGVLMREQIPEPGAHSDQALPQQEEHQRFEKSHVR